MGGTVLPPKILTEIYIMFLSPNYLIDSCKGMNVMFVVYERNYVVLNLGLLICPIGV